MAKTFANSNLGSLDSVVNSYTSSLADILKMGAHVITSTEVDRVVQLSTAFGESTHIHFRKLLLTVFDSWTVGWDEDMDSIPNKEEYLATVLECWTAVQGSLDDDVYYDAARYLNNLVGKVLQRLLMEAQGTE